MTPQEDCDDEVVARAVHGQIFVQQPDQSWSNDGLAYETRRIEHGDEITLRLVESDSPDEAAQRGTSPNNIKFCFE